MLGVCLDVSNWDNTKFIKNSNNDNRRNLVKSDKTDENQLPPLTPITEAAPEFNIDNINFFSSSDYWPEVNAQNVGGLGGNKAFFEQLGINVGTSSDTINSNDSNTHCRR